MLETRNLLVLREYILLFVYEIHNKEWVGKVLLKIEPFTVEIERVKEVNHMQYFKMPFSDENIFHIE